MAVWFILNGTWESKMEIPANYGSGFFTQEFSQSWADPPGHRARGISPRRRVSGAIVYSLSDFGKDGIESLPGRVWLRFHARSLRHRPRRRSWCQLLRYRERLRQWQQRTPGDPGTQRCA